MSNRLAPLIASLVLATAGAAQAQSPPPVPATHPMRFESWQPAATPDRGINPSASQFVATSGDRERHALLGGAIGAVVGVAFCTAVSTLVDDSADGGLSACPVSSYLLFGAGGFALGFALGWAI